MPGAYCKPEDVFETTNTIDGKEIDEAEVYRWIERANADINSCLAGIYEVPFAEIGASFSWDDDDDIPPMIRKWATKLASAYVIRKLFMGHAGKNKSPYADTLKKESDEYCQSFRDGELNLLDVDGNIIPRIDPDASQAVTSYSESYPYPAEHVMPENYEQYPNLREG